MAGVKGRSGGARKRENVKGNRKTVAFRIDHDLEGDFAGIDNKGEMLNSLLRTHFGKWLSEDANNQIAYNHPNNDK